MYKFIWIAIALNVYKSYIIAIEPAIFLPQNAVQLSEGEKQYRSIQSNANLPQYGKCWMNAIQTIDTTCNDLNEKTQAKLAIQFTKCFMEMSGGEPDLSSCDDSECIGSMSERVFQVYTNFYTHTHSICFYLRHQIWHLETEKTIHLLQSHSQSVSKQLELAGRLQINLLQQQREGLKVQRKLVENGLNLSEVLNESRGSLSRLTEQFRNSTIEQGRQLGDLFQRLAQFHNWIVGEYTFVEQIMYYSVLLIVIMIATTAKRSENCRFLLFLLAAVNIMIESLIQRFLNDEYFIEDHQIVLFNYLWLVRKLFIVIMMSVYVILTVMYVDSQQMTLNLLQRIHDQNKEIIEMLRNKESIDAISDKNYYGVDRFRRSVERDDIASKFKQTNCINNSHRLNVIREQSTERILNASFGVTTRLRSRQATPVL